MGRTRILLAAGAGLLGLVVVAAVLVRSRTPEAPAEGTHEPKRPAPVFHESLEGSKYRNQDLGLAVSGPEGWKASLGDRSQDRHPYEGTIVRMTPAASAPKGEFQPFVSVMKRTLSDASPRDPLLYIAREVLTPEKFVTEAPTVATLSGRRVGRVGFRVKSGSTSLEVLQVVYLTKDQAILLTATAPSGSFDSLREQFEKVFQSLKLES